jgi:putative colanic acid biosynthesis acetyltransferase WcaF
MRMRWAADRADRGRHPFAVTGMLLQAVTILADNCLIHTVLLMAAVHEDLDRATLPQIRVDADACPSPHSTRNKIGRVVWSVAWWTLFRPTPRIAFGWRRFVLRTFGATIGRNARISPSARFWAPWNVTIGDEASIAHDVDCYSVDRVMVGDHATVSQYAFLCTASHDVSDPQMRLTHSPIRICDQAWVCAGAFVAPGVTIGAGAVAGARAVVTRDVQPWTIVAGNPARYLRDRVLRAASTPT